MTDFNAARKNMVDCQIETAGVADPEIIEVFSTVPRERFVPEIAKPVAYMDEDLIFGDDRFLPEPITHAKMLAAVKPKKDDIVLDISNTNGYSAAILSPLVSTIICAEGKQDVITKAHTVWEEMGVLNAVGVKAPLTEGYPKHAPYDLIFMAGSVAELPQNIMAQLAENGRLITIVRKPDEAMGKVILVQSLGEKGFSSYTLFEAGCPYLPGFEPKPAFIF
ncbi:MAG: protein-L-isoaspartate O-methyltransferase [Alphaproteobacteria bacterium]|nr:protein-L-isoaspartate O-methyltransferase [Alphaproteobacteria bacterium]